MHKITAVIGTRPDVIKMAPVIHTFRKDPSFELTVLSISQHREMLDQMLQLFDITPDIDLNLMQSGQSLPEITQAIPIPFDNALQEIQPDFIFTQGDTSTAFLSSLGAYYRQIPCGHIEAGLRTHNRYSPYPEETFRTLITRLATLHFPPTQTARQNLLNEGISPDAIHTVGNPVIDALNYISINHPQLPPPIAPDKRLILVTLHRRENHQNLISFCETLNTLTSRNPDIQLLLPVHRNPKVASPIHQYLSSNPQITLTDPLPYDQFVSTMRAAYLILTDSGGIQEEAPHLGTPVLVLRDHSERPEAISLGSNSLIGTSPKAILTKTQELLDSPSLRTSMVKQETPYGDGQAAPRIASIVKTYLS